MDPSAWSIDGDNNTATSVVIPGWVAHGGGVTLRIKALVAVRLYQGDQDVPPQSISHFCRRRISSSDVVASEDEHFTIPLPYDRINHQPAWEEQTQRMFSHLFAANRIRPADLDLPAQAFSRYTYAVLNQFLITESVFIEFDCIVEIPIAPSASASRLRYLIPQETYESFVEGNDDVVQLSRGLTPASEAAVEGLQMATAGEDSSCSICLDPFEVMAQALEMPCGHSFHEGCLKEWLKRSNSCPLCRFSLPAAE